ncbi:MAG TPA: hypothetical protein PL193_15010 [Xanthobacteraceae bacterium]|nr:hypothetical protein [Xanthobacteraceae bacterium]
MSREKVHFLQFEQRATTRSRGLASRVPTEMLFLLGLAVAFVLAHYSDKPPLVEKPISLQRAEAPRIAEPAGPGVSVLDTGLRGFER